MATSSMTRADAGRAEGERETMRYAARNLRLCQMRAQGISNVIIAEKTGLSPSRTSRIISKGEDHWQMWLDRAIEEGVEQVDMLGAVPEPDVAERVELIDIRLIADNPFQSRTKFTATEVKQLMDDMLVNGQRIPIAIRPSMHDETPYELCWGQLRLAAIREAHDLFIDGFVQQFGETWGNFHDRATGVTRIKAIIQEMDDAELRKGAASENLNRNSMCWSDTIRALDDICENTDSTAAKVAALAKMSPQQLSNQRRLLRLPVEILDMVDDDVLAWTSARELLVFATPHHTHEEELDYCVRQLRAKMRKETDGDGNTKRIDARSVRTIIANALCHGDHPVHWEYIGDAKYHVFMGDGTSHGKELPRFDIEAFAKSWREWTHKVPAYGSAVSQDWTCAVEGWRDWQGVAQEEERRAEEEAAQQANRLGAVATAFSNETPRAEKLPRQILHMLEDGRLSHSFVHRLLAFVSVSHAHEEYLEEISDGLMDLSKFKSPYNEMSDAASGGVVLKALRKKMAYTEWRSLDERLTSFGFESPRFAMDEFIESQRPVIHNVPIGIGIVRVTCTYEAWDAYQEKETEAVKQQVARGNQPTVTEEEPAAQLMDMSMVECEGEQAALPRLEHSAGAALVLVDACPRHNHWHVMTKVDAPGFSGKVRRSPYLNDWDEVLFFLEELTDDGGDVPWVEEHRYDDTA